MTLLRLNELDPRHRRTVRGKDIRQFQIYSNQNQLVGKVTDALLDKAGQFYYLIADIQSPKVSNHVLIPLRQTRVDLEGERVYLSGLDATQITELPTYDIHDAHLIGSFNTTQNKSTGYTTDSPVLVLEGSAPLEASLSLESVTPLEAQVVKLVRPVTTPITTSPTTVSSPLPTPPDSQSTSPEEISLEQMILPKRYESGQSPLATSSSTSSDVLDEQTIRLLEERLQVNLQKRKVGEVIVRKEIETQIIEVPIRRERLVVEQISPEHKQLAVIDLSQGDLEGVELTTSSTRSTVNAPQLPNISSNVASNEFSSLEAAIEFLRAIANQSQSNNIRQVQIQLISDAQTAHL
ncbi:MAG: PRC-barrel domain-containing protein [Oculatellaceae cyanobacterium bins.114]|nr:PRC-barrel domain-containing protein [Oculatellaceae cyanobacterium bins.114]